MENNEVTDVRVVETVHNYTEAVKIAMITGVVSVLATNATGYLLHKLAEKAKNRQKNNTPPTLVTINDK